MGSHSLCDNLLSLLHPSWLDGWLPLTSSALTNRCYIELTIYSLALPISLRQPIKGWPDNWVKYKDGIPRSPISVLILINVEQLHYMQLTNHVIRKTPPPCPLLSAFGPTPLPIQCGRPLWMTSYYVAVVATYIRLLFGKIGVFRP